MKVEYFLEIQRTVSFQVGDVLVVYGGRGKISSLIGKITYRGTGLWSHTGMYMGNNKVQEATPDGVIISDVWDFLKTEKNLAICRPLSKFSLDDFFVECAKFVGAPYAWKQLLWDCLALLWKGGGGREAIKNFKRDPAGVTCTEWIGKVYETLGIFVKSEKADGVYIPPQYLAPNEFIDSFAFTVKLLTGMK